MKHEWPLGKARVQPARTSPDAAPAAPFAPTATAPDAREPLLPLALNEHVELILSGEAVRAIARKRAVQIVTHGHTPAADRDKSPALLAQEAKARLVAFLEIMPMGRMNLPLDNRERCLRYVEIAAGLLIALWDRCQVEVDEDVLRGAQLQTRRGE